MGLVMNIQPFSTDDGPGIRTVLFLKGCPLSCVWCHNPESRRAQSEIAYDARRCVGCGACASVCRRHSVDGRRHCFDRTGCSGCGECAAVCSGALEHVGEEMSAEAAVEKILRDADFFRASGGGITISGGEPLAQPEFCMEILKMCREKNVHTCMETSCFAPWSVLERLAPHVDMMLCDWKLTDEALHRKYVGVSNRLIRENILHLDELGVKIRLRCPIIPGVNDTDDHFRGIAALAKSLGHLDRVELMPYHRTGIGKNAVYGYPPAKEFRVPAREEVDAWLGCVKRYTNAEVVRG